MRKRNKQVACIYKVCLFFKSTFFAVFWKQWLPDSKGGLPEVLQTVEGSYPQGKPGAAPGGIAPPPPAIMWPFFFSVLLVSSKVSLVRWWWKKIPLPHYDTFAKMCRSPPPPPPPLSDFLRAGAVLVVLNEHFATLKQWRHGAAPEVGKLNFVSWPKVGYFWSHLVRTVV